MNSSTNTSTEAAKIAGNPPASKAPLAFAAGLFVIVFAPALLLQFGIHNDYWLWSYKHQCCLSFPETRHLFWIGRPIGALLLNLHFMFFDTIQGLAGGRAFSLLVLIATLIATALVMERHARVPRLVSVTLSTLIFLLPGSLLYVLWLTNFVPGIFNVLVSCVAYALVSRSYARGYGGFVLGYGSLLLSFYIYPPTSCFFLVFTASKLLLGADEPWQKARRQALFEISAFWLLSGVCYLSVKAGTPFLMHAVFGAEAGPPPSGEYRLVLATGLAQILPTLRAYASVTGGLWLTDLAPGTANAYWLGLLLLAGVIGGAGAWSNRKALLDTLQRPLLALVTLGLSAAPVLAAASGDPAFRNTFATSATIVVWIVAAIVWVSSQFRLPGLRNGCLFFLCAVAAAAAAARIAAASYNASAELEFVRKEVAGFDSSVKKVILLQPPRGDVIVGAPLTQDFGLMATNYTPLEGIVRAAMKERGLPGDTVLIKALSWEARFRSTQYVSADVRAIDMAQAGFRKVSSAAMTGTAAVTAVPLSGCCGPQLAFDRNSSTFFESDAGFPVELLISYSGQCRTAVRYRLAAHLLANLMPSAWELFGRANAAASWQLLDSRAGVSRWSDFGSQTFQIAEPGCFGEYSFHFVKSGDPRLLRIAEIVFDERAENRQKDLLQSTQISASSVMEPWGPEGVLEAQDPGWHVKSPRYPERLEFHFSSPRRISRIGFLPQRGYVDRAPQDVVLEHSKDGTTWKPLAKLKNSCDRPYDEWRVHPLGKAVEAYVRVEILSNCGAPDIFTLRGVRFE